MKMRSRWFTATLAAGVIAAELFNPPARGSAQASNPFPSSVAPRNWRPPAVAASAPGAPLKTPALPVVSAAAVNNPSPLTSVAASWEGIPTQFTLEPPDPHGAAGPNGIIQVVNVRIAYWSKSGQALWGPLALDGMFASVGNNSFSFDPRALYDPGSGRFYVLLLEQDSANKKSYLNVAVSKTSNPASSGNADWFKYRIENTRTNNGTAYWGDYPGLGFDGQAVYITVNLYDFNDVNGDAQITVLDKAALISGTATPAFVYTSGGPNGGFTLQPCTVVGGGSPGSVAYFGETTFNSAALRVWALSDPLGARTLASATVQIPDNGGSAPSAGAPQPGTAITIDTLDQRTQGNAFWQNGSIWFCHTAGGTTGKSIIHFYKVGVNGFPNVVPTLGEAGVIDGGAGEWTYQGSIGANPVGDICIVYTQSSPNRFPSIFATTRSSGAASFDVPVLVKASPGFYRGSRWGDYASATPDPLNNSFWVTHEFARSTAGGDWGTWWGNILAVNAPFFVVATNYLTGGNGNGIVDPNECNQLSLVLVNNGSLGATNVQATLSTTTPGVIVTHGKSFYPDAPVGAVVTNLVPFQFSTSPAFLCGTPVNFSLVIKSDQSTSTNVFTLSSGTAGAPKRYDSVGTAPIPDLSSGDLPIVVANFNSAILKATVSMHLLHTFDSDLLLQLISPEGITNTLAANVGGAGDNFGADCSDSSRTVFDDDASLSINSGGAPFIGSFRPVTPLSVFIGKMGTNVNGTWHLHVVDQAALDFGSIECWSLMFSTPTCTDGGGECPGSDLAISGSVAPDPLVIGGNLVYTLTIRNLGPKTAQGVTLIQTLPPSAVYIGASISQGNISQSGGTVNANIGSLAVGAVVTATITVLPTQAGTFNSTAAVAAVSDPDYDLSNNSILFTSHVNPPTADLAIGVVGTPNPVLVGGTVTYTISVTNNGPSTATGLTISNALSATLAVTSANPQGSATILGNTVIFNLGSLSPGAVTTATITAIPSALGQAVMTSTVRANQVDSISGNNTATAIISVSPSADLAVGFQSVPGSIVLGNVLNYTVSATNLGPSIATGVFISQTLPANAVVNSSSSSPGTTLSQVGSLITCNVGTLGVGGIVTINVQVAIATNEIATSTATISGAVADVNSANNSATVNTVVAPPFVSIQAASLLLLAENFAPANGAVDPGETVTVQFYLKNIGNVSTTNLTATLLATGGVTTPSVGAKNYTLSPGGFPDSKPFSFTASGTNGGSLTATLQLTNNGAFFTNVSFVFAFPKVSTFANTNVIVIPDSGLASPYPSTITVSGVTGLVGKVTATLSKFNHTYPHDVSVLLVSPTGARTLLMSHTADLGSSEADVNFTFDDSAPAPLPSSGSAGSGSWQPSGYAPTPVFPSPAPTNAYGSAMSVFNSTNPNGTWSLFVLDDSAGDQGAISNGWSLAISTISAINQVADLSLASVSSAGQMKAGSSLTNTFTITNNSTNLVNTLTFTSALATNVSVTISSVTVAQGNYTLTGGSVVASITNLNAGASATVVEVMTPNAAGSLTNTASVSAALIDLVPGNNTNYIVTSVTNAVADVSIATTASAGTVVTGSNLVYTISVTNLGPDAALNVMVTNFLPAGLSAVSPSFGTVVGNTLTCSLGNLAAGAGVVITVNAHAPAVVGTITNIATVTTTSAEANAADNIASVSTVVRAPAALIGAISARLLSENFTPANGTVDAGETVTVSLSLANTGEIDTTNLVATLRHTGGVTSPSGPVNYGAVIRNGPAVSGTFTFTASVGASGSVTATLGLQDGSAFLGTVEFTFLLPQTSAFANTNAIIIPDHGIAAPYPATITVAGLTGLVSKATVTLNGVTHSFPRDIGVLLVGPTGTKSVVMSGVGGGNSITNLTLTFDDAAATTLTTSAPLISGVAQPVSFPASRTFSSPAPSGNATALLSQLNGGNPNGVWSLYVVDDVAGDGGNISYGWSLALTTVSPLNPTADLFITASVSTNQINVGSQLTYTLRVTNQGPATVTGVVVTNLLPAGAALGTVIFSSGGTYTANAGAVVCNLNNLAVGAGAVVTIVVTPTVAGIATDAASVTANETDLNSANNVASASVTVLSIIQARLSGVIYKSNGQFQFTLTGQPNSSYVVQARTNLTTGTWTAISTNTAVNGAFQFIDTNAPGLPQRFYRAVLAP